MVVIAVIGLVLPAFFSIIFSILLQQTKVERLTQVKKQGDNALNVIENTIRGSAQKLYSNSSLTTEICSTTGSSSSSVDGSNFYFKDQYSNWFQFSLTSDKIASNSSIASSVNLTTSKVKITDFNLSCNRAGLFSSPIVSVSFKISYATASTRQEDNAALSYQTAIKLRTF